MDISCTLLQTYTCMLLHQLSFLQSNSQMLRSILSSTSHWEGTVETNRPVSDHGHHGMGVVGVWWRHGIAWHVGGGWPVWLAQWVGHLHAYRRKRQTAQKSLHHSHQTRATSNRCNVSKEAYCGVALECKGEIQGVLAHVVRDWGLMWPLAPGKKEKEE